MTSANGATERVVQYVKSYLCKLVSLQQNKWQALLYRLNNTPSVIPGASSAFVRFFGRAGCIPDLPTLRQKFSPADVRLHSVKREEAQNAVASSMKRSDPTIFKVGDSLGVRSPAMGQWIHRVIITGLFLGQDQEAHSYLVKLDGYKGSH